MSVGSDAWLGAELLKDGVSLAVSASVWCCMNETRWENLLADCSKLRGGINCTISQKFSFGTQNLVRLVKFEDDVKWVARVSLGNGDDRMAASLEDQMNSQIATYKFLSQNTEIPVPAVHGFSAHRTAEIGPPYLLLDYIHGTTADNCCLNNEQSLHVLKQLADMVVNLATHKFDRIGALSINESGEFEIGRDIETGGGPYHTAQEYYNAVSKHRFQFYANGYFSTNLDAKRDAGLHLPSLFNQMMDILTDCAAEHGPFSLTNIDIGFHNILLDETFKIVGMIDCDAVKAAPIHVVAQYPEFSDMIILRPGLVTKKQMAQKVVAEGTVMFEKYLNMIADAERRIGEESPLATAMDSDGARLFEGLQCYMGHQTWVNVEWIESYWYMYYRALRGPYGAVEFSDADASDNESKDGSQCSENGRGKLNDEEDIESIDHEDQQHEAAAFESIFNNHNRNNEYHENLGKRESESSR